MGSSTLVYATFIEDSPFEPTRTSFTALLCLRVIIGVKILNDGMMTTVLREN